MEDPQKVNIRTRLDAQLELWGRLTHRWRWILVMISLAFAVGLSSQAGKVRIDASTEAFLRPSDPWRASYDVFRNQFGREEMILIGIDAPEIFSLEFFEQLRALHEDLENEVPYLDEVTSLINARDTQGNQDELIVRDLFETWPKSKEDLNQL
ncbi:MAG: Fis family transcriptional regulator, partial [Deltaproteobacteria bacterium]|nr:Fis family transcriptional regulator [Deltaproteobacteria bacterium]